MERLQRNEFVLWEGIKLSSVEIEELKEAIDGCGPANLQAALSVVQQEQLQPLLRPLDEEAEREVRQCVRDVIATVAFSPYKGLDLAVAFYWHLAKAAESCVFITAG